MADRADRHVLYEESVQDPEAEMDFVEETFEELRGRSPRYLREDFCGTANSACEWVRRDPSHRAMAVDLDGEVLDWGREHHVAALDTEARSRIELVHGDVLEADGGPFDVVLAMNFSYWIFDDRAMMRRYFRQVRDALTDDGVFFMDAFGGYEAFEELEEETEYDDFSYVWDQAEYDPVTGYMKCHIHFRFPDGSSLEKAFTYEWRLWTLPEIREILEEAGFGRITVYWEGTDEETGEGNGEFEPVEHGDADAGWLAYVVAEK